MNDGSLALSRTAKWNWISGGFSTVSAGPADIHQVLSAGPYAIAPGATRTIPFALVAGDSSLENIQQNADAAKRKWLSFKTAVGIREEDSGVPTAYKLEQNYPNPFNPTTAISYQLPAPSGAEGSAISVVTLGVYDVLGREVAILVDGTRAAGFHTAHWDASSMPSGVYIYRLRVVDGSNHETIRYSETKKMVLLR